MFGLSEAATKIIAIVLVLVAVTAWGYLGIGAYNDLIVGTERAQRNAQVQEQARKDAERRADTLEGATQLYGKLAADSAKEAAAARAAARVFAQKLEALGAKDDTVRAWTNAPVPAGVRFMRRIGASAGGEAGGDVQRPNGPPRTDPGARDERRDERSPPAGDRGGRGVAERVVRLQPR